MKTFSAILMGLLIFFSCKGEKQAKQEQQPDTSKQVESNQPITFNPPQLDENYYRELFQFQEEIILNPSDRKMKERYIFNAYFADNNTLLSFGSARKINPQTKQAIAYPLIKRAALLDAKRWGTYGLLWLNNDFEPDYGKIKGTNSGQTLEVFSFDKGDSLIIALANKVR
jgi:hypothetical protein